MLAGGACDPTTRSEVKGLCFYAMHQLCRMGYTSLVKSAVNVMLDVHQRYVPPRPAAAPAHSPPQERRTHAGPRPLTHLRLLLPRVCRAGVCCGSEKAEGAHPDSELTIATIMSYVAADEETVWSVGRQAADR